MASELESRFDEAVRESCRRAWQELRYRPRLYLQMLGEYGGVETARRLLLTPTPSEGYERLWREHRLDLSVENDVLRDEFKPLFTVAEREIARARLVEYGFSPPNP